jgi:hypothetical protein
MSIFCSIFAYSTCILNLLFQMFVVVLFLALKEIEGRCCTKVLWLVGKKAVVLKRRVRSSVQSFDLGIGIRTSFGSQDHSNGTNRSPDVAETQSRPSKGKPRRLSVRIRERNAYLKAQGVDVRRGQRLNGGEVAVELVDVEGGEKRVAGVKDDDCFVTGVNYVVNPLDAVELPGEL